MEILKKNKKQKNKKRVLKEGFSLIEVLVALFVFSLLVASLSGVYVGFLGAQLKARETQRNLEAAQLALNSIAKTLRTSKVIDSPDIRTLRVYDYSKSSDRCMEYTLTTTAGNESLQVRQSGAADSDESQCASLNLGASTSIVDGRVLGGFNVIPSSDVRAGRVTMVLSICPKGSATTVCHVNATTGEIMGDPINIQTSVSLRSGLSSASTSGGGGGGGGTYAWWTGNWGTCSQTCGGGTQARLVICKKDDGTAADESNCTEPKPATSQACNTQGCVWKRDMTYSGGYNCNTPPGGTTLPTPELEGTPCSPYNTSYTGWFYTTQSGCLYLGPSAWYGGARRYDCR